MTDLCESREVKHVPEFILLMSRFCRDFQQSTVEYILTLTDEQFHITTKNKKTSVSYILGFQFDYILKISLDYRFDRQTWSDCSEVAELLCKDLWKCDISYDTS